MTARGKERLARFERGARLLGKVHHARIAQVSGLETSVTTLAERRDAPPAERPT